MKIKLLIFTLIIVIFLSSCTKVVEVKEPCADLSGKSHDICFYDLAVETEASLLDLCSKIQNEQKEYDCFFEIVDKTVTPYDCDSLFNEQGNKDLCNYVFGSNLHYIEYCDFIVDDDMKDNCLNDNVEFHKLSSKSCEKIKNLEIKQICFDSIKNMVEN